VRVGRREDTSHLLDPTEIAAGETRSDLRLVLELLAPTTSSKASSSILTAVRRKANVIATGTEASSCEDVHRRSRAIPIRVRGRPPRSSSHDPRARWPESILPWRASGARDVELRFSEPGEFDPRAEPGPRGVEPTQILSADEDLLAHADEEMHEDGRVRLRSSARFFVEVLARGHARGRLGPYEPLGAPASVECSVEALPGAGRSPPMGTIEGASSSSILPPPGRRSSPTIPTARSRAVDAVGPMR
jgi:hypothetical protein